MQGTRVGEVTITRVIESERPDFDAAQFFPDITPERWAPYRQRLAGWAMDVGSNGLVFPMQAFLVRTKHHTIVVDTCVGDHKKRVRPTWNMTTGGEFMKRFAETGVKPEQVDYVMCTHMHNDHVGWNTRWENGRWVQPSPTRNTSSARRSSSTGRGSTRRHRRIRSRTASFRSWSRGARNS
jgi:beta-lactamase superfamily II metal-dependent hydrolase